MIQKCTKKENFFCALLIILNVILADLLTKHPGCGIKKYSKLKR